MFYRKDDDVLLRLTGDDGAMEVFVQAQGVWQPYARTFQDLDPTTLSEIDEHEAEQMMTATQHMQPD